MHATGLAVSSGQAAQFHVCATLCAAGDNIVSTSFLYGGTYNQFKVAFPRLGVNVKFTKANKPEEFAALIDEKTKVVYLETIGRLKLTDQQSCILCRVHIEDLPLINASSMRRLRYFGLLLLEASLRTRHGAYFC